ncbi:MAG: stage V sporulation T C-terminal domain-containing protein, partial [Acutalibacteraceae bacterium]
NGVVVFIGRAEENDATEADIKLATVAASFLGKQIE